VRISRGTLLTAVSSLIALALLVGGFFLLRGSAKQGDAAHHGAGATLRSPFTGDPVNALSRVLIFKIDNVPQARPPTGLTKADIVYVLPVEGGLSRIFAVFSSHFPPVVGPVRSSREEDIQLLRQFGRPAFAFSGAQPRLLPVVERLYTHDWELTRQLLKKASDLDLLRLEIPPEYGGLGLDLISASFVGEQIAMNPSFGGSLGAHTSIGTLPLVYFGTPEQKERYLRPVASGRDLGCMLLTEPQAGSDAANLRTRATRRGDHFVINGTKSLITSGRSAAFAVVIAVTDPDAGKRGISAFLTRTDEPGYNVLRVEHMLHLLDYLSFGVGIMRLRAACEKLEQPGLLMRATRA